MPPSKCDPDYWFLSPAEDHTLAERQRRWVSRNSTTPPGGGATWKIHPCYHFGDAYTRGNRVVPLVDGENYMSHLLGMLQGLGQGDVVLIVGWEFWAERNLDAANTHRLLASLQQLARNQVQVRLVAYDNIITSPKDFVAALNVASPQAIAVSDGAKLAMSHHQKAVFAGHSTFAASCGYVGGIDLAIDRWDDNHHAKTVAEKRFIAWHDIQVAVWGNAILQIWANFADRWEGLAGSNAPCHLPQWATQKNLVAGPPPGSQAIQLLRTVAPASAKKRPTRFMPSGERTVLAALTKAIAKAECYIYIEEQFLWDCELAGAIRAAMQRNPELRLLVVLAADTEFIAVRMRAYHYHLRSCFFMNALGCATKDQIVFGHGSRVYVYGLYQDQGAGKAIYVHSKLVLIDDRYVAIGSANVNRRSMHIETELTLGIVDEAIVSSPLGGHFQSVGVFAKNLRETLWQEHLGRPHLPSDDPIAVLQQWFPPYHVDAGHAWPTTYRQAKNLQVHRLRCYINAHEGALGGGKDRQGYDLLTSLGRNLYDRSERALI